VAKDRELLPLVTTPYRYLRRRVLGSSDEEGSTEEDDNEDGEEEKVDATTELTEAEVDADLATRPETVFNSFPELLAEEQIRYGGFILYLASK